MINPTNCRHPTKCKWLYALKYAETRDLRILHWSLHSMMQTEWKETVVQYRGLFDSSSPRVNKGRFNTRTLRKWLNIRKTNKSTSSVKVFLLMHWLLPSVSSEIVATFHFPRRRLLRFDRSAILGYFYQILLFIRRPTFEALNWPTNIEHASKYLIRCRSDSTNNNNKYSNTIITIIIINNNNSNNNSRGNFVQMCSTWSMLPYWARATPSMS